MGGGCQGGWERRIEAFMWGGGRVGGGVGFGGKG